MTLMDLCMLAMLAVSFLAMLGFVSYVDKIIKKQEVIAMWILGVVIVLLAAYLVYALINPEKF